MTELLVKKRENLGKKVKSLRKQGLIPAELYGHNFENIHLAVSARDFLRVYKEAGESAIVKLRIESLELKDENEELKSNEFNVLINDIQKNCLTDEISHIDFYSVRMDEKITAAIPLKFINESPAVKEKIGILIKTMHEIEVESFPADLPRYIEVDINSLSELGASIHVKNLKIGKGVKFLVEPETVIATITELVEEEVALGPATVEEVKVEEKGKEKEETVED